MTREERKAYLRWNLKRICENCIHARELTEEETVRYKDRAFGDKPDLYCTYENKQGKYHPHAVPRNNCCFCHEYDDESVMLPANPMWRDLGVNDLWPYELERRDRILLKRNQITMEEIAVQDGPEEGTAT